MKSFIFIFFLCLPFLVEAQKNVDDSFVESFVSQGYIKNKKFVDKITVIRVDWYADSLFVGGAGYSFEIVGKKPLNGFAGTYLTFVRIDTDDIITLVSDKEGLRGLYSEKRKLHYEIEIGDVWAEMENAK